MCSSLPLPISEGGEGVTDILALKVVPERLKEGPPHLCKATGATLQESVPFRGQKDKPEIAGGNGEASRQP